MRIATPRGRRRWATRPGRWIQVELTARQRIETLELDIVADGRHSVPTVVKVAVDDGAPQAVSLPEIADRSEPWSTTPCP